MKEYLKPTIVVEQIECEGIMEQSPLKSINFSDLFENNDFQWK